MRAVVTPQQPAPVPSRAERNGQRTTDPPPDQPLAVALSGGGHRASLFGLGALWALADIGARRNVSSIASVSGGSITNAFLAMNVDVRGAPEKEFVVAARQLATSLASRWGMFGNWPCLVYLAGSLAALAWTVTDAIASLTGLPGPVRLAAVALALTLVVRARSWVADCHFKTILGKGKMSESKAEGRYDKITNHVVCATSLRSGEHFYMSPRFLFSPIDGWAGPNGMRWSDAVRASAALPVAFPPKWIKLGDLDFSAENGPTVKRIPLSDGGVFDNLANTWPAGLAERLGTFVAGQPPLEPPRMLVVVNSSAALRPVRHRRFGRPLVGPVRTIRRVKEIMYNNGAALRTEDLIARFDRAALQAQQGDEVLEVVSELRRALPRDEDFAHELLGFLAEDSEADVIARIEDRVNIEVDEDSVAKLLQAFRQLVQETGTAAEFANEHSPELRGVVVQIDSSPIDIIDKYSRGVLSLRWPERAARARQAHAKLVAHMRDNPAVDADAPRTEWRALATSNRQVKTRLESFGPDAAAALMYQAYVVTIVNAWVILGSDLTGTDWLDDLDIMHLRDFREAASAA